MKPEELLKYEMSSVVEYVSWDWLQEIIAKYYAKKVTRKLKRYRYRKQREVLFKNIIK